MAATHMDGPRPLPRRRESLQIMLDLEKQFKLARLQAKTPPKGPVTTPQPLKSMPTQARRRESGDARQRSAIPTSIQRAGPIPPLSITIPSPTVSFGNEPRLQVSQPTGHDHEEHPTPSGSQRHENGDANDDNDDAKSVQSSICQSPSWEGYGQKKKDKKKKQMAEQQKREAEKFEKSDQEHQVSAKKRLAKRLVKAPPAEQPVSGGPSAKSGRFTPSGSRSLIPEAWGLAVSSGRRSLTSRSSHSRSASASTDEVTAKGKGKGKEKETVKPAATTDKNYPPLSSRSHALRHSLLPVRPVAAQLEDLSRTHKDNYKLYTAKNLSDQDVDYAAKPSVRGRQRDEPEASTAAAAGSYVGKTRAQSIERHIKGFMQEAALSDPNLLNAPNRMAFSYLSPPGSQPATQSATQSTTPQRPGSSTASAKGEEHAADVNPDTATPSSSLLSLFKSRVSRRSSISSGSTSITGKSFKERAMGAMQMQSGAPSPLPPQTPSHPPAASPAATPQIKPAETTTPAVQTESEQLPKATRVLGEVNHETISQSASSHKQPTEGSSASSSHDESSSVSASPASTPGTSRPQSAKCVAACSAEIKADTAPGASTDTLAADHANKLSEGLGILHEAWSQSTVAPDNDAQSFVTTLTNQRSIGSLRSQAGILNLKEAALLARHGTLETHPAFRDEDTPKSTEERRSQTARPVSRGIRTVKTEAVPRQSPAAPPAPKRKPLPPLAPPAPIAPAPPAPLAKMLVECCHCKFFHDMPSRVYECMAQPDAVVTDRHLGVSGAITTMVKCPWCAHNMSTQCCAGYAAVVYLKERLH